MAGRTVRQRTEADANDPLVIDSRSLTRQPGSSDVRTAEFPVPEKVGNDVAWVEPGALARLRILLESVLDGILVTADGVVGARGECVRCLEPLKWDQEISFRQFFTYPGVGDGAGDDEAEDVAEMHGDLMDVRPAFHDAVVLALPLTPLCRPDCAGLCAECGFKLADDPQHRHTKIDPRWSALAGLPEAGSQVKESD
ncbi:MAG: DUF177 domain-containing protein [Candidatus Nanopelagicales bacterium]|nr:DUF177 domain-containing protein [Candidatus Nanopelagicales bacterium]MDZ4250418.1 DUF177 domain-containing protein [Candidatus Nanopelagicales bacterium]MDZ7576992.1 DUF177 domain-containing protein [Candidatus Nanopelagicales bacterium]